MATRKALRQLIGAVAAAALFVACVPASAQINTPGLTETAFSRTGPYGIQGQQLSYLNSNGDPTQQGKSFSEVLRGNGTRAGYVLSHGGVVPSSVRVSTGARSLRANVDYYLDAANGALYFAEPVRSLDSISVFYTYVEGQDGNRNPTGIPGLALNFRGTALNFGFGMSSANGLDFNTYGLALNSTFGGGKSGLRSLVYFSSPAGNVGNRSRELTASLQAQQKAVPTKDQLRNDHLITQDLNLKSGAATFRATYQDVGQYFTGFQAMRQSNSGSADVMAQIAALEKEKGVKRLGFGAGVNLGKSSLLDMDWSQIADGKGAISRQAISLQAGALSFKYGTQTIGQNFARFNGLREAEAAQWARERGTSRTDLVLGFNAGKGSQLSFSRNLLDDKSGSLSRQMLGFTAKNFNFAYAERRADAKFARLNDLSDAEKTSLALDIRKQFNPNATAAEVTAKDKEQLALDAGLSRRQMALGMNLSKQTTLAFNQFTVDDGSGRIGRMSASLAGKGFSLNYLDQTVGDSFGRLGRMSDFERSMFANERGIHRTSLGMNLTLGKTSGLSYSQLSLSDSAGAMSRQSLAYQGRGLNVRVNLADTAKSFARARDLAGMSDGDKQAIEAERGYKRMDFSADFTGLRGLLLNTYVYRATNAADQLGKDAYRHSLAWTPNKASHLSLLLEGNSFSKDGSVQNGRDHSLLSYDTLLGRGMKFNLFHDTVATKANGHTQPTVTTDFLHFETDRSKSTNLLAETKRIDLGNGHFENTTQFDMNVKAGKTIGLHLNRLSVDRGKDPSADTNTLQWTWQLSKALNFTGSWADTRTNNNADVTAKAFALSGGLGRNLNLTGSYAEIATHGKNVKAVSDVTLSTTKPMNVLGLKDAGLSFRYAAVNDQHKQQTEQVSGRLQGMLGKNQVAFEYGGTLDQKGNSNLSRGFSIVSDRNAKLPLHFDLSYRAINVNRGGLLLERKYNVDYRMDKLTSITYTYSSLPLNVVNNQSQPLTSSVFSLKRMLTRRYDLSVNYTTNSNAALHKSTNKLLAMINGKTSSNSSVQVGYSVDIDRLNGQNTDGHTVQVGYDQKLDANHYVTLSGAYTMYRGSQPNTMQANIDFKTIF